MQAQIKPISSHFNYLNELYNPSFYGVDGQYKFALNYRNQWVKLEGSPNTLNFLSSFYLPRLSSGIGLSVSNDQIGAFKNTTLQLGYNYIIPIKDKLKIGIGLQAGFEFNKLDGSKLITPDGTYLGNANHNDNILSNQITKDFRPYLNTGISLSSKYLDVGIAYLNVIDNPTQLEGSTMNNNLRYKSVLQTVLKSKIKAGKHFEIEPALSLNTDFVNVQTDIFFMTTYNNFIGLGTNIRGLGKKSFESVAAMIKVNPIKSKSFGLIYSYDFVFRELGKINKGTHEMTLYFNMKSKSIPKKMPKYINNPRFL